MFSKKYKKIYLPKINEILKQNLKPTERQIRKILKKKNLGLNDIYFLIQTNNNPKLRDLVIETANKKREEIWNNRLFLVPPLYVTDRCINDCLYCPWRKSNNFQRRSLKKDDLKKEIDFLIKQGYRIIELVGASDPNFDSKKIEEYIKITKEKLEKVGGGNVGLNFESAIKEDYENFIRAGLYFMVLWQETYHPETYKKLHPENTKKSNMDYRLDAFDRAIQSGLKKVSLAFLGRLYDWRFEVLALFCHGRYLEKTYGISPFIIGTPRWRYAKGCVLEKGYDLSDENWLLVASIYKLAFPTSLPWFSTREKFELSKKVIKGGGAVFTLDCSTAVGGYTLRKDFPQFPVYSKSLKEGIKWLKSLGYKPEVRFPKIEKEKYVFDDEKDFEIFMSVENVLNRRIFPIMSEIEKSEIDFINKNIKNGDKVLEVGCGGGRVLKKLKSSKKNIFGTDINKKFVDYCKRGGFNVFYLDVLNKVPENHKEKYDIVFLAYNLLYNFDEEKRKKIIQHCNNLLKQKGKLILTIFADTKISLEDKLQMRDYYAKVINAPENFKIKFVRNKRERGFGLLDDDNNLIWFSRWKRKEEIIKESKNWKNFVLKEINLIRSKRAYNVVLEKNKFVFGFGALKGIGEFTRKDRMEDRF